MVNRLFLLLLFLLYGISLCVGQQRVRIVAYNVENLYDVRDDPKVNDKDFTPAGRYHWTQAKYNDKILKLSRVLADVGEGELPAFIGLSEIENRGVLEDLVFKTILADGKYGIVHEDSPDLRGMDVALLYRQELYTPLQQYFITVKCERTSPLKSRDILYSSGILAERDTIHFFVCHFPSMLGGEAESEWKRMCAASLVRSRVDSIRNIHKGAAIVIMGDLNGRADRPAQQEVLGVKSSELKRVKKGDLYNTGYYLLNKNHGSYKYKGKWQTIDHIIVSGALLKTGSSFYAERRSKVFAPDYLLEEDKKYYGYKPFRTYLGFRYHGGYSDHLPVYLDLIVK